MSAPARVALIGATGHGASHRRTIGELADAGTVTLVAVGDIAPVPDVPAGVPVFADHRELLARTSPEIVVVCTPPHTHLTIAEDVLWSGADLLLEKPPVLDRTEHDRLAAVIAETGRSCQIGFQALASPALAELLSTVDSGGLGRVSAVTAVGAWKRDESYFGRADWVGRQEMNGRRVLDGALANPFAHAVMQVLAIARRPLAGIEVERYRTRDIQVDDTASLRLTFDDGSRALVAVTLCAEEFVPGEIAIHGASATALLEYPTDRLQLPSESEPTRRPGRPSLLANLVAHRSAGVPLVAPLERTLAFTTVLEAVMSAPVHPIGPAHLRTATDLPHPRLVIGGVNAVVRDAAAGLALFSELAVPWAARPVVSRPVVSRTV
jgi:predicted dehydrogenase